MEDEKLSISELPTIPLVLLQVILTLGTLFIEAFVFT
jgi:hypothetical protein